MSDILFVIGGIIAVVIVARLLLTALGAALAIVEIAFVWCLPAIVLGALTWWLFDKLWIGAAIGVAWSIYKTIKAKGVGWAVIDTGSGGGSSRPAAGSRAYPAASASPSSPADSSVRQEFLRQARAHEAEAISYQRQADEWKSKAESEERDAHYYRYGSYPDPARAAECMSRAATYMSNARNCQEKANWHYEQFRRASDNA